jgi:ubiquinone/menaquinone biosynthesis C-methylase UbiE
LDIAQRVGPQGRVLATDLSPAILDRAEANCRRAGYTNVETLVADAEELAVEPASFDAAVSRLGLMLFPRPLRAIRAMHAALRPGGGVCTMVFGRPARNPCITILLRTALEHAGLPMPEPRQPGSLLSLGQPGHLDRLFHEAGFRNVATTLIEAPFALHSAREYVEFVQASASPIQQILSGLEPDRQDAAWEDIEERLAQFQSSSGWVGPNELALTAARR